MLDVLPLAKSGANENDYAGFVRAHGFTVSIVRRSCDRHLCLEAVMSGTHEPVYRADAGTIDPVLAEVNAERFAAGLAAESPASGATGPTFLRPTWTQLEEEVRRRGKDVHGLLSRMRAIVRVFGRGMDERVGPELGEELEAHRETYRLELMKEGKAPSTIAPYLSKINKLAEIAASMAVVDGAGATFGDVIRAAAKRRAISISELARIVDLPRATIAGWMKGRCMPTGENRKALPAIEKELGFPEQSLSKLISALRPSLPVRQREGAANFAGTLRGGLRRTGTSVSDLARQIGMPVPTVQGWMSGKSVPGPRSKSERLPRMEEALDFAPGELSALVPRTTRRPEPYAWTLTPTQQESWEALKRHKTKVSPDRNSRPRAFWKMYDDGTCPTAGIVYGAICRFFGFLTLAPDAADPRWRGMGRDGASLSLLDLANPHYVEQHVEFLAARSGYNTGTTSFLQWLCALLRPKTGYFWQARNVGWADFPPDALLLEDGEHPARTLEQWRSHCERMASWIDEWLEDLAESGLIRQTRDYRHIQAILDLDRPIDILRLLLERMEADYQLRLPYMSPIARALMTRDLLFVSMLFRNPLRRKHWFEMTWNKEGTGQLRKRADGDYELFIPKRRFKALAGFRDDDYLAWVDPHLTRLADYYLEECRPLLVGAGKCDFVFRPVHSRSGDSHVQPMRNEAWLATIVVRYIPEYAPRGFSSHAVRHIIATHLVRNLDDGIDRAADALHNTRKMILKTYGHLRGRDLTAKAQRIIWNEYDR